MTEINRRSALALGGAAACAAALPAIPTAAAAEPPVAEMFVTTSDEPWGAFVRGHVTDADYERAVLRLLALDRDAYRDGEGWLFEEPGRAANDGDVGPIASPQHTYMRLDQTAHPLLGEVWKPCDAEAPGAIPITIVFY